MFLRRTCRRWSKMGTPAAASLSPQSATRICRPTGSSVGSVGGRQLRSLRSVSIEPRRPWNRRATALANEEGAWRWHIVRVPSPATPSKRSRSPEDRVLGTIHGSCEVFGKVVRSTCRGRHHDRWTATELPDYLCQHVTDPGIKEGILMVLPDKNEPVARAHCDTSVEEVACTFTDGGCRTHGNRAGTSPARSGLMSRVSIGFPVMCRIVGS